MPSALAIVIFTVLIVWLLRHDSRTHGPMSAGLWIPFLWIAINLSRPVVYWFASGDSAAQSESLFEGNAVDRNIYLALIALGIVVLVRRHPDWKALRSDLRWLMLLYAYFLGSTLWSDYGFIAFKRWVKDAGDIVMILVILTDKNPMNALRTIFVRCAYILVPVSVLFIKWLPSLGRYTHRWTYETFYSGVTLNKNTLGLLATLCGLFVLWQIFNVHANKADPQRGRKLLPDVAILLMCTWLSSMARSATASTCFALGAILLLMSQFSWGRHRLIKVGWMVVVVSGVLFSLTVNDGFRTFVAEMLGRRADLTERTAIWEFALELDTNPLVGTGFSTTWLTKEAAAFVDEYNLAHAHNGFLETYLHTGIVGVALVIVVLLVGGINASRVLLLHPQLGGILVSVFWIGILQNYTEVTFSRSNPMGLLQWLFAAMGTYSLSRLQPIPAWAPNRRFTMH